MKPFAKNLMFSLLILAIPVGDSLAQGILQRKGNSGRRGPTVVRPSGDDSSNRRQDVEGTIWEYKVIDPKEKDDSKETVMTGRIRIKQSSVFAVGKAKVVNKEGKEVEKAEEQKAVAKREGSDVRGQFQGLLSQRMNRAKEEETGGERIGDFSKRGSSKYAYEFDEDDDYPLSGLVNVEPDTEKKNGVWSGNYEEFAGGRKVKRWRFEMRKIDE